MKLVVVVDALLLCCRGIAATAHSTTRQTAISTPEERAAAVAQTYQIAWDGYYKYAFPHDELKPLSNGHEDPRNEWGASAIDGLDTAILMGKSEIVDDILGFVPRIDFGKTLTEVSLFETTIRYIGGLLAAYDLLKGPFANSTSNATAVDTLLTQSKSLADHLSFAFGSGTGIPYNNIDIVNKSSSDTTNGLATIGSLVLEWTHLSDLLGDDTYANLTEKAESYLLKPQYIDGYSSPWPGLLGTNVDIETGLFQDASGGWNGGDDSYYEYLIKMFVYDQSRFSVYRDAWVEAADSSIEHLASHPSSRPDLTFLAGFTNQTLSYSSGHLACFDGGNFLLAGSVLDEKKYIDFGLELVAACEDTYNQTLTGIGPEGFAWTVNGSDSAPPADQKEFYERAGFWVTSGYYILRPEVLESFYYAYRITGDDKYREWSWNGYLAINASCAAGSGYAELYDVTANATSLQHLDEQDSFFFAEVLKYAYLIQTPDAEYQTNNNGVNAWVFNTEAHLFKVAGTPL